MAKVRDALNPTIVLIDGAAAGAQLQAGHEYVALVHGLIGLFFLGNTALRSLKIRKEADNLRAQIESQKTPTEDDYSQFG